MSDPIPMNGKRPTADTTEATEATAVDAQADPRAQAELRKMLERCLGAALGMGASALQIAQAHRLTVDQLLGAYLTAAGHIVSYLILQPQFPNMPDRIGLVRLAEDYSRQLHEQLHHLAAQLELGGEPFLEELRRRDDQMRRAAKPAGLVDGHGRPIH